MIKIPHKQIKNIVYTVDSGSGTWTKQNNSIKYTAEVAGMYRFSVLSIENFKILTRSLFRNNLDTSSGTMSTLLLKGFKEEFILEPVNIILVEVDYHWCLEFVAESS